MAFRLRVGKGKAASMDTMPPPTAQALGIGIGGTVPNLTPNNMYAATGRFSGNANTMMQGKNTPMGALGRYTTGDLPFGGEMVTGPQRTGPNAGAMTSQQFKESAALIPRHTDLANGISASEAGFRPDNGVRPGAVPPQNSVQAARGIGGTQITDPRQAALAGYR